MRQFFMLLALVVCVVASATEMNDTVVFNNPSKVTVMTNDSVQRVKVSGREGDEKFHYESTVSINKSTTRIIKKTVTDDENGLVLDLGYGWAIPTNTPEGHGFAVFKSWEWMIGLRYCYTPKKALQTYSVGLWCDWRSYTVPKNNMISKNADNVVVFGEYPSNVSETSSKIRVFSLSVPFLFTQKFGKKSKASFSLGPVVNFNVRGRILNEWTDDDIEHETSTREIGQRPVTVDFMGILKYGDVGMYCKYSPMSVLKNKSENGVENPQFHSLTFGLFF
jgi:hypothetical protein